MRAAVVRLPGIRTVDHDRQQMRAAARQLERVELYLASIAAMEIGDREARRGIDRLRAESQALRRYLGELAGALRT